MRYGIRTRTAAAVVLCLAIAGLGACGGEEKLSCDKPQKYQQAVENPRVVPPDDLNNLDPLAEMPLPDANPAPARPAGSPCLDLPPRVTVSG